MKISIEKESSLFTISQAFQSFAYTSLKFSFLMMNKIIMNDKKDRNSSLDEKSNKFC